MLQWAFEWYRWVPGWNALQNWVQWLMNFVWWLLSPSGIVTVGRGLFVAMIDWADYMLPDSVDPALASMQGFVASPAFSSMLRIGAWFIDQIVVFQVVLALFMAFFWIWTSAVILRICVWIYMKLPTMGGN